MTPARKQSPATDSNNGNTRRPGLLSRFRIPTYLAAMLGIFFGLGIFVTLKSNALSYLSNDPKACVNCHVMGSYYASHAHSSHANVATCNDCHVPHTSVFAKYAFKAKDGLYHSSIFTLRAEPQAMRIKEAGANVVQANCVRCHGQLNENVQPQTMTLAMQQHGEGHLCWDCHRDVPHGSRRSISNTPGALVPYPTDQENALMPAWLTSQVSAPNAAQNKTQK